MSGDFCCVFSGECRKIPFLFEILPKGGGTDATVRHSNNNREKICDFLYVCTVPIFFYNYKTQKSIIVKKNMVQQVYKNSSDTSLTFIQLLIR